VTSQWQRSDDTAVIVRDLLRRLGEVAAYVDDLDVLNSVTCDEDSGGRWAIVQFDDKTALGYFGGRARVWEDGEPVGQDYRAPGTFGLDGSAPVDWQPDQAYQRWARQTLKAARAVCSRR
jgi:hypothetical protein